MDPGTGRFISRDTWAGDYTRPMSFNSWLYVYSNPVNLVDPSGYCADGDTNCITKAESIENSFSLLIYWPNRPNSRFGKVPIDPCEDILDGYPLIWPVDESKVYERWTWGDLHKLEFGLKALNRAIGDTNRNTITQGGILYRFSNYNNYKAMTCSSSTCASGYGFYNVSYSMGFADSWHYESFTQGPFDVIHEFGHRLQDNFNLDNVKDKIFDYFSKQGSPVVVTPPYPTKPIEYFSNVFAVYIHENDLNLKIPTWLSGYTPLKKILGIDEFDVPLVDPSGNPYNLENYFRDRVGPLIGLRY